MTPRERADEVLTDLYPDNEEPDWKSVQALVNVRDRIEDAIIAAVEAETERSAKLRIAELVQVETTGTEINEPAEVKP